MHQFICNIDNNEIVILDKAESHHAVKVLRIKEGASVVVTDGKGKWCEGTLVEANSNACLIRLDKIEMQHQRPVVLKIAIAPTKNIDRFEWFLEKATECGIDESSPVFCTNSERTVIKPERLQKVLVAAMKQSLRAHLPVLSEAIHFKEFIEKEFSGNVIIAHCQAGEKLSLHDAMAKGQNTTLLVGPEGDFTPSEIGEAVSRGFVQVSLGNHRLRTETAALVSCVCFNFVNDLFEPPK
jgi:16S rRNA (uracil1498-N3)-methyltransferase